MNLKVIAYLSNKKWMKKFEKRDIMNCFVLYKQFQSFFCAKCMKKTKCSINILIKFLFFKRNLRNFVFTSKISG